MAKEKKTKENIVDKVEQKVLVAATKSGCINKFV